jgi:hypothetical protein
MLRRNIIRQFSTLRLVRAQEAVEVRKETPPTMFKNPPHDLQKQANSKSFDAKESKRASDRSDDKSEFDNILHLQGP